MNIENLKKAIKLVDSIANLSILIGEKAGTISMWLQRKNLPAEKVLCIAEATGWEITPNQLRPDLYPHPHDGLPEHLRQAA